MSNSSNKNRARETDILCMAGNMQENSNMQVCVCAEPIVEKYFNQEANQILARR